MTKVYVIQSSVSGEILGVMDDLDTAHDVAEQYLIRRYGQAEIDHTLYSLTHPRSIKTEVDCDIDISPCEVNKFPR